jgi:hypothetical protein
VRTLKRLSWRTFLIAMSSRSLETLRRRAWKTTPKEPLPITLQFEYWSSRVSPDLPSEAMTLTTLFGSSSAAFDAQAKRDGQGSLREWRRMRRRENGKRAEMMAAARISKRVARASAESRETHAQSLYR